MRAEAILVLVGLALAPAALGAQSELQPVLAANLFGVSKAGLEAGVLVKPHGIEGAWWPTAAGRIHHRMALMLDAPGSWRLLPAIVWQSAIQRRRPKQDDT
jgi:hypothetical protein